MEAVMKKKFIIIVYEMASELDDWWGSVSDVWLV